ncbi:MAG: hypothetical protein N2111_11295 [Candidatus Sumerlaeaceae bacterium]|nr:hypothetical protein [Candidatus Sumerlaeaceae bacterium]
MALPEQGPHRLDYGGVRRVTGALALAVLTIVLFGSFYCNFWGIADDRWFLTHQHDTESLVIGRLVKSRQDGLFSAGGFLGAGIEADLSATWIYPDQIEAQYRAYRAGGQFEVFSPYLSQPGGQGVILGILDRVLPLTPPARLEVFYALLALLCALVFAVLVGWFAYEAGAITAGAVACSVILSQWITVFARNLWWNLWVFYLPMMAVGAVLIRRRGRRPDTRTAVAVGLAAGIGTLLKYAFTGFEFVTTFVVMAFVPIVYEAVRERWTLREMMRVAAIWCAAVAVSVGVALLLLAAQIGVLRDGLSAGFDHIVSVLAKRSYGSTAEQPALYAPALQASVGEVLGRYISGNYFAVKWSQWGRDGSGWWSGIRLSYGWLIGVFAVSSAAAVALIRREPETRRRSGAALVAATWFSLLAPLSWFVVFKAHSFVHVHVNFIVWQMPFTLFGFAVVGWLVRAVLMRR